MSEEDKHLGENIAAARKEAGFSQESLSQEIFVTRQAVSNWERGRTRPSQEIIEKLAGVLGVTAEQLLKTAEAEKEQNGSVEESKVGGEKTMEQKEKRFSKYSILIGLGYALGLCLGLTIFFVVGLLAMQPMVWAAVLFGGAGIFLSVGLFIHFLVLWKRPE